jgi:hypothetical protein
MADIDVVPKRRTNVWVWIIAALALALILLAVAGVFSGGSPNRIGESLDSVPSSVVSMPALLAVV